MGTKSRHVTLKGICLQGPVPVYCLDEIIGKLKQPAVENLLSWSEPPQLPAHFPVCSLRICSAAAQEISVSDIIHSTPLFLDVDVSQLLSPLLFSSPFE